MAIDFMAGIRGHRQAKHDQFEDFQREVLREKLMQDMRDKVINRQSQRYLSTLNTNRQDAIAEGMAPDQYLIRQLKAIQGDQGFRSLDTRAQSQVLSGLQTRALSQIKDLHDQGLVERANQMASAFGVGTGRLFTPAQQATMAGNLPGMLDAINKQYGSDYALNEDGTVTINNVHVPGTYLLSSFAHSGYNPNSINLAVNEYAQTQKKARRDWEAERQIIHATSHGTDIGAYGVAPDYSQVPVGQAQAGVGAAQGGVLNEGVNEAGYGPPRSLASDAVFSGTVPTQPAGVPTGVPVGAQNPMAGQFESFRVPLHEVAPLAGPDQSEHYGLPPEQDIHMVRQNQSTLQMRKSDLILEVSKLNLQSEQAQPYIQALKETDAALVMANRYLEGVAYRQEIEHQIDVSSKVVTPKSAALAVQQNPGLVKAIIMQLSSSSVQPSANRWYFETGRRLITPENAAKIRMYQQALTDAGHEQ